MARAQHGNRGLARLGEPGRTPAHRLLAAAAAVALLAGALALLPGGAARQARDAEAHDFPVDCDMSVGAGALAAVAHPGTILPVNEGQIIHYRVGAAYAPDDAVVGCQAFDVQVWFLLPGDDPASDWQLICTLATLDEGEMASCPNTAGPPAHPVAYTASGADRNGQALQAFVAVSGDKHDHEGECLTPDKNPNRGISGNVCFGAQATSKVAMPNTATPTNTPTNTPTATNTPTNTPTATNTPTNTTTTNTPTVTRTPGPNDTPTRTPTNTPTNTPVSTVAPATVVPTNTPVGVILPDTGRGTGGGNGGGPALVLLVMGGAAVAAVAGALRKRARNL